MIPAPPLPTAEEQHGLSALLTRRLVLTTVVFLMLMCAVLVVMTAYRAVGRTAGRIDPIVAPAR